MDDAAAPAFRRDLQRWYRGHGRHGLPWRHTRDPYAILVSEVMLQQTQVSRVEPYYVRWMARWPDVPALAAESPAEVIRAWAGLGYNRRALALHRAAVFARDGLGGRIPAAAATLLSLPGVGAYTAAAVACFAGGAREPFADTNIARVLARAVLGTADARQLPPVRVRAAAELLLPIRDPRAHNLALMDLGALVCVAREPRCRECPLARRCAWLKLGQPAVPQEGRRPAPRFESTARFARGRLVDALRECPLPEPALRDLLPERHREATALHLAALAREGLAVRLADGRWSLPGMAPEWPAPAPRDARDPQGVDYSGA